MLDRADQRFGHRVLLGNGLLPLAMLAGYFTAGRLGANPIAAVTRTTGILCLTCLLLSLSITPIRRLSGFGQVAPLRRTFGLLAFLYGTLHFLTYIVWDQSLDLRFIAGDLLERPFIGAGFFAYFFMVPLAATSTQGMVKRLGGERWRRLHRRVYLVGVLAVVHYVLLVKADLYWPLLAGLVLLALLLLRAWFHLRGRGHQGRQAA